MKEIGSFLQKFGPWFLLCIIGLAIILVGLIGGIPKYFTVPADKTIGVVLIGGLVALFGGIGLWREKFHPEKKHNPTDFGIRFNYPADGASLKSPIDTTGTFKVRPKTNNIYTIELNPHANRYWPKGIVTFNPKNNTWSARMNIGGGNNTSRILIVAEMPPAGLAWIDYHKEVRDAGIQKGIADFHLAFTILDQVTINLRP